MDLKTAKSILENEVKNIETNIQKPLSHKYARWEIIDYLWASCLEEITDGECIEWLKGLYESVGMTEGNMSALTHEAELMLETIRRNPLK